MILIAGLLLINSPVFAQEAATQAKEDVEAAADLSGFTLKDDCDFSVIFPSEPFSTRRCGEAQGGEGCYSVTSYTQVYDMATTVNVSVSCNDITAEEFANYGEPVMRAAMRGMASRNDLDDADVSFQEKDGIRIANLSATGRTGRQDQIYVAQLWISPQSVFTVEAQLIGGTHPQADKIFGDILRSIAYEPQDLSQRKQEAPNSLNAGQN